MIDNGCDQTIINIRSFLVQSFPGVYYSVGGVLNITISSSLEFINEPFTLATLHGNSTVIFQINQAFLDRDPLQT